MIEILTFDEWQQWLRDNMDYIYKMKEKFQRDEYDMPPSGDYPIEGGAYISFINMGTQQKPSWKKDGFNIYYISRFKHGIRSRWEMLGEAWPSARVGKYPNQIINKKIIWAGHEEVDYLDIWDNEWGRRGRFYIGEPLKKGGVASDYGGRFLNWSLKNPWEVKG